MYEDLGFHGYVPQHAYYQERGLGMFLDEMSEKTGEIPSSWLMKRHSCVHVGYKLAPEWQENMAMANMNYGMPQGDVQPPSADPQVQWWVQKSRGLQIDTASHWMSPFFWGIFFPPKTR